MKILLSNDDGIDAKGIKTLAKVLGKTHEVYVIAPVTQKSGFSHSVTYFYGDRKAWRRIDIEGAFEAYAVEGTPADCVYFGCYGFLEEKPDVVISGINHGPNLSTDALYSGTIGAAAEGLVAEIPSIAVSLCTHEEYDFTTAAEVVRDILPLFMQREDRLEYVLSINVPALPKEKIKGYKVTRFDGMRDYEKEVFIEEGEDSLILRCPNQPVRTKNQIGIEGDVSAVENGYISITPITMDWSSYAHIDALKDFEKQKF